jgi:predicted metal-binding membrane protein
MIVVGFAWMMFIAYGAQLAHGKNMLAVAGEQLWSVPPAAMASWVLMTVVMMGPSALAGVRHTGMNSLCWRRGRAMAEFSAAYLAVWAVFGIVVLGATAAIGSPPGPEALAASLIAAAAWELTPYKQTRLRECHRGIPLPPSGWRAERAALTFGVRNGAACLGSCWCLMLVMVACPGNHIVWTVALTALVTMERIIERPRSITRWAAVGLGVAAISVA